MKLYSIYPSMDLEIIELVYAECNRDFNKAMYNLETMIGTNNAVENIDKDYE